MALENTNKEYLKIVFVTYSVFNNEMLIRYYLFRDKSQRLEFEKGLSPYEKYNEGVWYGEIEPDKFSVNGNIRDAILTVAYKILKEKVFTDWEDI